MLAQISTGKAFIISPQALGDLSDRTLGEQAIAVRIGKRRFDVAHPQTPRLPLDRQPIGLLRAAPQRLPDRRTKRFGRATHQRHPILNPILCSVELSRR